jgi:hypothetical protein
MSWITKVSRNMDHNKKWPCGKSINEVKKYLEENTHCGKCWHIKAKFDRKSSTVSVYMAGNERVTIDLITGVKTREDYD